jgi:hypothetical protein
MVIVEINSGLGNQMFQYAAGKALAAKLNTELLLDISWYKQADKAQTPRNFELTVYPFSEKYADEKTVNQLIRPSSSGIFNRLKHRLNRSKPIHKQWAFVEPHFHFYPQFFEARNPVYISGYWQSEQYFLPIANQIREVFSIDISKEEPAFEMLQKIAASNCPVSMHVRRGDMVKNPEVAQVHGSCNIDYYKRCMQKIEQRVDHPEYFVFSDDPEWCKENLKSNFPIHFVTGNDGSKAFLDIQLMRHCHHHIIANSSFSWWGAWLNPNPAKIVLAPMKWFNAGDHNTSDLTPPTWERI